MRLIVKLIFIGIYIDFMNILLIFINYQTVFIPVSE